MSEVAKKGRFNFDIEEIIAKACELPYCRIDRDTFLRRQLKDLTTPEQLDKAIKYGTINSGIPIGILNYVAKGSIKHETTRVSGIATITGLPGGLAMAGTIPADILQFYAHVFRIAQKLAYIYGAIDTDFNDNIQQRLLIYLGAMLGVEGAVATLTKFAAKQAGPIGLRIAGKPMAKSAVFIISKKILANIGVKLSKGMVGRAVTKTVPIVSGVMSGGLSYLTFMPMALKLKKDLSELASMSPEKLEEEIEKADIILDRDEFKEEV